MTTLLEYATSHFPHHATDSSGGDHPLTEHTAVAHVIGRDAGLDLARRIKTSLPSAEVGAVLVEPTEPTVVPEGGEDPEGMVDLPHRRLASAGLAGAVVVGLAIGIVTGLATDEAWVGVIVGAFAAIIGAVIATMASGGGRYAGERAWEQPHAPDRTIAVVAAFVDTEDDALGVARVMEAAQPFEVRIVNADGAWHSPNT